MRAADVQIGGRYIAKVSDKLRCMAERRELVEERVPWGGRTITYWRALGPDEAIG